MSDPIAPERLLAMVRDETIGLAAAAAGHLELAVPGCPGWDVAALAGHLGMVQLWVEAMVRTGARERLDRDTLGRPPAGRARLDWLRSGAERLTETLATAGPDRAMWMFDRPDGRSGLWVRRMAHEAQIHRADAECAAGAAPVFEPRLAADGVDEFLRVMLPRRYQLGPVPEPPGALALVGSDTGDRWTVRLGPRSATVDQGVSGAVACTATGPAGDLFRMVWNRPMGSALAIEGDPALLRLWRAEVRL